MATVKCPNCGRSFAYGFKCPYCGNKKFGKDYVPPSDLQTKFKCPNCSRRFELDEDADPTRPECPYCNNVIKLKGAQLKAAKARLEEQATTAQLEKLQAANEAAAADALRQQAAKKIEQVEVQPQVGATAPERKATSITINKDTAAPVTPTPEWTPKGPLQHAAVISVGIGCITGFLYVVILVGI